MGANSLWNSQSNAFLGGPRPSPAPEGAIDYYNIRVLDYTGLHAEEIVVRIEFIPKHGTH